MISTGESKIQPFIVTYFIPSKLAIHFHFDTFDTLLLKTISKITSVYDITLNVHEAVSHDRFAVLYCKNLSLKASGILYLSSEEDNELLLSNDFCTKNLVWNSDTKFNPARTTR